MVQRFGSWKATAFVATVSRFPRSQCRAGILGGSIDGCLAIAVARRRKNSGSGGFIYFLAPILGYFVPAVLVGVWVYFEFRCVTARRDGVDAGWDAANGLSALLPQLGCRIRESEFVLASLYQQGDDECLERRADGRFDARSKAGRRLNAEMGLAEETWSDATSEAQRVVGVLAGRASARLAVFCWAMVTTYFMFVKSREFMSASALGSLLGAGVGLILYLIVRTSLRRSLS